jgi:nucleoside recognition membrane protein YjiH
MRPKFYTGGLTVRDGRLVNERIGDGMTGIGMACQVYKAKKYAEKEAMISRAIMSAEMQESMLGMKEKD